MYNVLFHIDTVNTSLYRMYQIYWVINESKDIQRKLLRGTCTMFCSISTLSTQVCTECIRFIGLINESKDIQRKLLKGTCTMFCSMLTLSTQLCTECITFNCIHVNTVNTCIFSCSYGGCWPQDGDRGVDIV